MIGPMQARPYHRWIAALTAFVLLTLLLVWVALGSLPDSPATAEGGPGTASVAPPAPGTAGRSAGESGQAGSGGAVLPAGLELSKGKAQLPAPAVPVADGKPLAADQIAAIIKRLPSFAADTPPIESFRWPTQSIQKPNGGPQVPLSFPGPKAGQSPADAAPSAPSGPLKVLRMQPQGAVAIAPFISVTFNQPMVPVGTLGQLAAVTVPITMTPKVAGSWQWIGVSTVRFVADSADLDRLPMATDYTVTVPAGIKSATGSALAKPATFTFSTPPPTVKNFAPTGASMKLNPIFLALFDQKVNPAAVLAATTVTAGSSRWPIRPATPVELAGDAAAAAVISAAPAGRVVAFRPSKDLPTDQPVQVSFAAGTPSAEGPRTSAAAATFTGHTYAALTLTKSDAGQREPGSSIGLTFNNALDQQAFDPTSVSIVPKIPGAVVSVSGTTISIQGATDGDTSYTVTVPAGLRDVFGQKLAEPAQATVIIGPASTRMDPFPGPITTLDPLVGSPALSVNTVNRKEFRERVFAVSTKNWPAYQQLYIRTMGSQYHPGDPVAVPDWPVLLDRTVAVKTDENHVVATDLDLDSVLKTANGDAGSASVIVLVEPTSGESISSDLAAQNRPALTWAQQSTIGLDALNDSTTLRAWATDLRDGSPLAGVRISLIGKDGQPGSTQIATTSADGLATMDLTRTGGAALLATNGSQSVLLPSEMWSNSWMANPTQDQLLWYVNDDRQTYRPGESVSIKGWVRQQSAGVDSTLTRLPKDSTVTYTVRDGNGNTIGTGSVVISALGGFNLTTKIPDAANLGGGSVEFTAAGVGASPYTLQFQIADFRTPDFEVDTHADSAAPHVVGDDMSVVADAAYYAGGPLSAASVDWQVRTAPATYSPPGWTGYTFGIWTPWWGSDGLGFSSGSSGSYAAAPAARDCCGTGPDVSAVEKFSGTTDPNGVDYLNVKLGDLGAAYAGLPVAVTAQATVTDVNRQAIAGTADLLVHPADDYVGLSSADTFISQGKDLVVQAIATNIEGGAVAALPIDIRAAKVTTSWNNGASVDTESDPQNCRVTSTDKPVTCTFTPAAAGTYRITATVTDKAGRTSRSQLTRWVAGPQDSVDNSVQAQQLTIVPDRKDYQPGQKVKLLVQSPIVSGSGLLTVLHNGIASTMKFAVADGSAVVEVPVTQRDIPGISASIEVVGTAPRSDAGTAAGPLRPAYATGSIEVKISTQARTLTVTATPRDKTVAPGSSTELDVAVTDAQGNPVVGSEFEVVVADEAVLALGGYQLPDPVQAFYPPPDTSLTALYGRSMIALTNPTPVSAPPAGATASYAAAGSAANAAPVAAGQGRAAADSAEFSATSAPAPAGGTPIVVRKNFQPLALFVPAAVTDSRGRATITVPLPDSLTRYRVMVVAVAGDADFGTAESTITAGLPVTVRPSAPAFLNYGDTLKLPVLVQNQTSEPMTTDVVIQVANLKLTGPAGKRVTVPAHGRLEVDFAAAADRPGTAKFRVAAVGGNNADAATIDLPVYTPSTTESFAAYGIVKPNSTVRQPLAAPKGVLSQFGGLQISTSSTALQQLTDAVGYLANYSYDSSDALAGQIIAIDSLGDVLQAFSAPGLPSAVTLKALVSTDVDKLSALQNADGGFPYWNHGENSDPFNSIQATQALLVAKDNGSPVSPDRITSALNYLKAINSHILKNATAATRDTLRAYALRVRMQAGQRDPAEAAALVTERGAALPLDAVAWLLPVVTDAGSKGELLQLVSNAAVDNAGSVTFTNTVTDDSWTTLQSNRRTDGLLLDALITVQPSSDLIPKVVSGLMAAQRGGRWNNVQENSFILLALRHLYDVFESATPDFVAGVWLGDRFAGDHSFTARSTERATVIIPTKELIAAGNTDVTMRNKGTGTLYYRLGLQTAPSTAELTPLDRGFVVSRTYSGADNPSDVTRSADGRWHIKAGATVKVQVELVSHSAHSHVALIDPLPAGLQILNPALATTGKNLDPKTAAAGGSKISPPRAGWNPTWFDHQNLRDVQAEAFADWLQGGVYSYSYLAKATTSGTFVAPPTRAEQVYAPETFGRAGTVRVVIGG